MHAPVNCQRALLPKALSAEFAHKGPDVVVNSHVLVEVFAARKRVATHFANITLLPRVHRHVNAQLGIVHARFGTHLRIHIF